MYNQLIEMFKTYAEKLAEQAGGTTLALVIESDLSGKFLLYGNSNRDVFFTFRNMAQATNTFRKLIKGL